MSSVVEITDSNDHEEFINKPRAIVFFGSEYCGHCRNIFPKYEMLAHTFPGISFGHVEVTEVETENVDGVPVFVAYKDGKYVDMSVGASEKALMNLIQKL